MTKPAVVALLAFGLSACVSTLDQKIPETADTPQQRKAVAAVAIENLGRHWALGYLPLKVPSISGPFASKGITGSTVFAYCISAIYDQGPFRKVVYGKANVGQAGSKIHVSYADTRGISCQGESQPFNELAELVAQKTGVSVKSVFELPPPAF
ncbi:hypothetical protein [Bosea sp. LC85]|uniref:hypothetical protein n=1 Tax=Bosea sp. LC85 TaxID=1502851 RepID=UPI0005BDEA6C|nr:hypothetical protein [Bosea sp. LC85]